MRLNAGLSYLFIYNSLLLSFTKEDKSGGCGANCFSGIHRVGSTEEAAQIAPVSYSSLGRSYIEDSAQKPARDLILCDQEATVVVTGWNGTTSLSSVDRGWPTKFAKERQSAAGTLIGIFNRLQFGQYCQFCERCSATEVFSYMN